MIKKALLGASIALATTISVQGSAFAQQTLKISFNAALGSTWDAGAQHFKDLVEDRSEGRYRVEIYPNAMLANGNDRVEVEMVQAGAIDMVLKSTAWLSQLDRRFMALALPFAFSDDAQTGEVLDGDAGRILGESLESTGLTPLAWGLGGSFELCTKNRPVENTADIAGLKIRMPGIRLFVDAYEALGAVPVTMSFAEAFTALQTGTVDADTCGISLLYSSRFYEAVSNIAITGFSYEAIGLLMNSSRFNGLPESDRTLIAEAAREAMAFQREHHLAEEREILHKLPELGMTVTHPDAGEIQLMRDRVAPVVDRYRDDIGSDFVDLVLSAVAD